MSPFILVVISTSLSDDAYINALYQNALRGKVGIEEVVHYQENFYNAMWDSSQVMINFAESPEKITLAGPAIANGIWLPDV